MNIMSVAQKTTIEGMLEEEYENVSIQKRNPR